MDANKFLVITLLILFIVLLYFLSPIENLITGFLTATGQLTIGNSAPTVENIYINDTEATHTASDVTINPVSNTSTGVLVKATINDDNGDCNTFDGDNGTAYLCSGTDTCNAATANHTITMNYDSGDGQWGTGNRYCNLTGTAESMQFYEINGTWRVNVSVTDGTNESAQVRNWTYNELRSFTYPASGSTINMGILTVGQWNNGTGQGLMQNAGNIIVDLLWNATDFVGQNQGSPDTVEIDGTNYIIDDDALSPDDSGNINQTYINDDNQTQVYFDPGSGLLRCEDVQCANTNATMNVYWHIDLPLGLQEDTYQNTIEITSGDHV